MVRGGSGSGSGDGQGGYNMYVLSVQVLYSYNVRSVLVTFSPVHYHTCDCTALCMYDPYMVIADVSLCHHQVLFYCVLLCSTLSAVSSLVPT